ncbi:MAG: DUF3784 domain-containing protein [Bacteroidia bacterium]
MIWFSVIIGAILIGSSFLVNAKNAPSLLAGYNKLSAAEKLRFPLREYIGFVRRWLIGLGIAKMATALLLIWLWPDRYLFSILILLFGLALMLIHTMMRFDFGNNRITGFSAIMLILLGIIIGWSARNSQQDNTITLSPNRIAIEGSYGLAFPMSELIRWELTDSLPPIRVRRHGYNDGKLSKGIFITKNEERVRLFIRKGQRPYLYLETRQGEKIWFGLDGDYQRTIAASLQQLLPEGKQDAQSPEKSMR